MNTEYQNLADKLSKLSLEVNAVWLKIERLDSCVMDNKLRTAAQDVVTRWDSPDWKWDIHTGVLIQALREALAEHDPIDKMQALTNSEYEVSNQKYVAKNVIYASKASVLRT